MKAILTFIVFLCSMQLSAQFASFPETKKSIGKNSFNVQYSSLEGVGLNFERSLLQKNKFSLFGQVGLSSVLPLVGKSSNNSSVSFSRLIGFSANIGLAANYSFNESHSIRIGAGLRRYQFYKPDTYQELFSGIGYDQLSKYLDLEYRFQPKDSKFYFLAGYRHSFHENFNLGGLKLGMGFKF